jgi:hypothetical protein
MRAPPQPGYPVSQLDAQGFARPRPPEIPSMLSQLMQAARWFRSVWTDSANESNQTWRRHVRGLIIGWALTASAMSLAQLYPNPSELSMYGLLLTQGLPWQQQFLAAIEIAAPLLMGWHLFGLQRWGQRQPSAR